MKKSIRAAKKRFVRIDSFLQRLRVAGEDQKIRQRFEIPAKGFKNLKDFYDWQEKLLADRGKYRAWQEILKATAVAIGLPENYISNLETFLTLNSNGAYAIDQPEIPHIREEDKYFRNRKLLELSSISDSLTGKKKTAGEVAEEYDPLAQLADRKKYIQFGKKKMLMYEFDDNNFVEKLWPVKEHNQWLDRYGLFTGDQVRKIISRHKKRYS